MGEVYLAEHVRMKRKCAVKVMRPGLMSDPDAISRFIREAENASQVNHPNVAAVYDFGETSDGLIYLAMEYVEGESLAKILDREKAIHPIRASEIIRQAAEALDVAHSLGILHRDLKPENIMITRTREHLDAVKIVRPPLTAFYESLTDEQKARFNEIGPDFARAAGTTKQRPPEMTCGGAKAGLSGLAVDRIENALKPTGDQEAVLKQLSEAMDRAVAKLETACPTAIALTPVGRLEAMQQRLEAMIAAAEIVRPALEDFYAKLSDEQKAKLNRLGRETARRDR